MRMFLLAGAALSLVTVAPVEAQRAGGTYGGGTHGGAGRPAGGGDWHGARPGGWQGGQWHGSPRPGDWHGPGPRPSGWSGGGWHGRDWHDGHRSRWGGRRDGRWWGGWNAPGGWGGYHRPYRGWTLPGYWISPGFAIGDYGYYGLSTPPAGYGWTRYYDDAVLIDGRGRVYDTRSGLDWNRYDAGGYDSAYDVDDDYRAGDYPGGAPGADYAYDGYGADYPPPPPGPMGRPAPIGPIAPPAPPPPPVPGGYGAGPYTTTYATDGYMADGWYYPGATTTTVTTHYAPAVTTTTEYVTETVSPGHKRIVRSRSCNCRTGKTLRR